MPRKKLLRERAGGGAKRGGGGGGGLAEWDVGQISICYPEVVISPIIHDHWPKSN